MFGETLDEEVFAAAEARSLNADVFFCVGTSFTVQPAARLPVWAKRAGAVVVEVNPHPTPCRTPPITRSAVAPRSSSLRSARLDMKRPD
jgi:NAD-dependent SIR2 family protein deacetylase